MALTESSSIGLGGLVKKFSLPGIDGETYTHDSWPDAKALVLIFMCNHCPYVQALWPRLIKFQAKYGPRGVQLVGINSNDEANYPEDNFENMKKYASERGQNFPYLRDETQNVARDFSAVCTPDIFVYDSQRMLVYHGRFDDNWKDENTVKTHDLADAVDAVLAGGKPKEGQFPSMGCSIKWKESFGQ